MRLLVIDDSATIRKVVELSFRPHPEFTVEMAETGGDGLARAKASPPDVILLDYVLPDMKGIDVCRALSRSPGTTATPILLVTAKGEEVRAQFSSYPTVVDYVIKPFTPGEIVRRVREAGSRSPGKREASRPASPSLSHRQKEEMAQAIFTHLRDGFARIPQLITEMGSAPPAQFFARRLLTREVMDALIPALLPHLAQVAAPPASAAGPAGSDGEAARSRTIQAAAAAEGETRWQRS